MENNIKYKIVKKTGGEPKKIDLELVLNGENWVESGGSFLTLLKDFKIICTPIGDVFEITTINYISKEAHNINENSRDFIEIFEEKRKNNKLVCLPRSENQYVTMQQLEKLGFKKVDTSMVNSLNETLRKYSIDKPIYIQHFLAQTKVEGSLSLTEAGWCSDDYVKKNITNVYEAGTKKGKELGNICFGDGFKFRGGGYIQMTGRYNYQKYADTFTDKGISKKIMEEGADYIAKYLAWDAGGYWWKTNKINSYIDKGASATEVSRAVNRGLGNIYNSKCIPEKLDDRLKTFELAKLIIK